MGFVAPLVAGIGSLFGAGAGAGAVAAVGEGAGFGLGAAATAGAGTLLGSLGAASSLIGGAAGLATALKGAPKPPTLGAAPLAPATNPLPAQGGTSNRSLAALSPGLALAGTGGFTGASPNSNNQKTLLGQ